MGKIIKPKTFLWRWKNLTINQKIKENKLAEEERKREKKVVTETKEKKDKKRKSENAWEREKEKRSKTVYVTADTKEGFFDNK